MILIVDILVFDRFYIDSYITRQEYKKGDFKMKKQIFLFSTLAFLGIAGSLPATALETNPNEQTNTETVSSSSNRVSTNLESSDDSSIQPMEETESNSIKDYTSVNMFSENISTLDSPFRPNDSNNNMLTYKTVLINSSNSGEVIPAGTKVSINFSSPSDSIAPVSFRGIQSSESLKGYFSMSGSGNSYELTINQDLLPGEYNIFSYFAINNPGWNWDGLNNSSDPAIFTSDVTSNLIDSQNSIVANVPITPATIYIKPVPNSPVGGLAGFMNGGYNNTNVNSDGTIGVENGYPTNFITYNNGVEWFNPSVDKVNGKYYQTFVGAYLPAQLGVGNPIGLSQGQISFTFDKPVDENSIRVTLGGTSSSAERATDITDKPGVNLSISKDKKTVTAEFSQYMQNSASFLINQWRTVNLMVAVPVDDINTIVNGTFNLQYPNINWNSNFKGAFTNPDSNDSSYPYFRGNDATVYTTDNPYNPLTDVNSYVGYTNNNDNMTITNLNGYPIDGVNPDPGVYTIEYKSTNKDTSGKEFDTTFSRKITVIEDKSSISGENYTMFIGDKDATVYDFKASATDKDGNAIDVTADLSSIDFSKTGSYDIILTASDGQTKTVKLIIEEKENQLVPIYRAYNPNDGDHLYTISEKEYDWITGLKWSAEGIAFKSVLSDYKDAVTIYRLYNSNSGEHFYTLSEKEYNNVASKGWTKEGIGFYMVPKEKGEAVYRVFNPNATGPGSHLFTSSKEEAAWLVGLGWKDEKIAFYSPK